MRLSSFIRKEDEDSKGVLSYEPKKLAMDIPVHAKPFTQTQPEATGSEFKLDELISKQTGVYAAEKRKGEDEVNNRVLEKVQEIQEKAYKEAYDLGLQEGAKKAIETNTAQINMVLEEMGLILKNIVEMKKELLIKNESMLVDLVYYCAQKVVHKEIDKTDSIVPQIIKDVMDSLNTEESISIRLNDEDYTNMQNLMQSVSKDFGDLSKIKFYPTPDITRGGCVFETNHGLVDATLEERFKKLWDVLNDNKPTGNP